MVRSVNRSVLYHYEHPHPPSYKSYSKTKPIWFEEFEPEQARWNNREENKFAWKVSVEEIKANNYNLDIKNPHRVDAEHADLDEMLKDYQTLMALGNTHGIGGCAEQVKV